MDIFKRKCPRCLKAVPFRAGEERAGGTHRIVTVACTSCETVIGVLPYMNTFADKRELASIVRGEVRTHVNSIVKRLKRARRKKKS
ncbi:MAG TPA: hypothetical protein VJN22_03635 [Candidatus Eremiobacteraceae bacterium]|nr:hypothetical protein [Candidatus Eremiobacteraceae bacterium]